MEKFPSLEKFYTNAVGGVGDNYEVCLPVELVILYFSLSILYTVAS